MIAHAVKFWRNLSCILIVALAITAWNIYIRTGYPAKWDTVSYGMGGGEVWALCGKPDAGGATGLKHDSWVRGAFLGHWELRVICGDIAAGNPTPVTHIELVFKSVWGSETWIKRYSPFTRIVDHKAYHKAFGLMRESNGTDRD